MLVINRKVGERVKIADNIWVTVLENDGNRTSLGFEAPSEVRILREETAEERQKPCIAPVD